MKARDLEWRGHGASLEAAAFGIDTFYRVEGEPGNWTLISPGPREYLRTPGYGSQAVAKGAAQVDLDLRVRGEIDRLAPQPDMLSRAEPDDLASYPAVQTFLDRHVLQYMHDHSGGRGYDFLAFHLRCFVNDWITKDMARAICRSLTDRGFARYERGLWTEDGETAGAGYRITDAGREYLNRSQRSSR